MKKSISVFVVFLFLASIFSTFASASSYDAKYKTIADGIVQWQRKNIPIDSTDTQVDPDLDWTAFSAIRSGYSGYEAYLKHINTVVSENFDSLSLSDLARIAISVGAANGDATNVGGRDIIQAIADSDFSAETSTTVLSYALIAINSKDYTIKNKEQLETEILDLILSSQRSDGGFNSFLEIDSNAYWTIDGEIDATGMVLQALAFYKNEDRVKSAIDSSLSFLISQQLPSGGFGAWGESAESTAQVITALCALDIDPTNADYVKDGKTMLSALQTFVNPDGGIKTWDGSSNYMSSYQALYALNAYQRLTNGSASLFDLRIAEQPQETTTQTTPTTTENTNKASTSISTPNYENPEIPDLGDTSPKFVVAFAIMSMAVLVMKKHEKK